jgi:hypothetical protein
MKITIEGSQGEGKSWTARQIALLLLDKKWRVSLTDGDDSMTLGAKNTKQAEIHVVQNGDKDA